MIASIDERGQESERKLVIAARRHAEFRRSEPPQAT